MTRSNKPGCLASLLQLFGIVLQPTKQETNPPPLAAEATGRPEEVEEILPYRVRDDFLSPAELNYYRVLLQTVGTSAVVCPNVSLGDLFYPKSGAFSTNQAYRNKIDRKHVDFLLCEPQCMRPLAGIELDDGSHSQPDRQERDRFVEQVFSAAGLPLLRQPVRAAYNTRELAALLKDQAGIEAGDALAAATPAGAGVAEKTTVSLESGMAPLPPSGPPSPSSPDSFPQCPRCGQPMVLRTVTKAGPHQGNQFWGCRDYPRCRGVRPFK